MTEKNWQSDNILCDLSHLGLLAVSGEDALTFLQGQVTNDVKALNGSNAHYSAYCSPKGRMLALFFAFKLQDALYLQFSQPLLAPIMKRLKMYVMRSKVEIADVSEQLVRFGVNGPDAADILSKTLSTAVPTEDHVLLPILEAEQRSIGALIKLPSMNGQQRFEVLINANQASRIADVLKTECVLVNKPCWDWLEIQTGLPEVVEATQEAFVPQMLNLDRLNGISFKKGCYTGQEIVARTHYLGKVKRRTYLATMTSALTPQPGDKVLDAAGNEVGQMVRVAPNLTNGFDTLIEIRSDAQAAGVIAWNNHPVTFNALPYTLEDDA